MTTHNEGDKAMNFYAGLYIGLVGGVAFGLVLGAWLSKLKGTPEQQALDDLDQMRFLKRHVD